MSPSQLLATALQELGVGHFPPTNDPWVLYYDHMPNSQEDHPTKGNNAICVYNIQGKMNGRLQMGRTLEYPGWQIKVRGTNSTIAHAKATAVAEALDGFKNISSGGTVLKAAHRKGSIIPMGLEPGGNRFSFTINGIMDIGSDGVLSMITGD